MQNAKTDNRILFYNCHRVKLSLLSLELSFRSLLQVRHTTKWQFYTVWHYKIKGVNYKKKLVLTSIMLSPV